MTSRLLVALAVLSLGGVPRADAATIYGFSSVKPYRLFRFSTDAPGDLKPIGLITGISATQWLDGIAFRPADGRLYAFAVDGAGTDRAQLYVLDTTTAALTAVDTHTTIPDLDAAPAPSAFDPLRDRLRVIPCNPVNAMLDPTTGRLEPGGLYTPVPRDYRRIATLAYTPVSPAGTTTLYGYHFDSDTLVTIGGIGGVPGADTGQVAVVGDSGIVTASDYMGFDIDATGQGWLAADTDADDATELHAVDLATGRATPLGDIGPPGEAAIALFDIAVAPRADALYADGFE